MNNLKAERTITAEELQEVISECDELTDATDFWGHNPSFIKAMASMALQSLSTQRPMGEARVKGLEWLPEKYVDHVLGWRSVSSVIRYFVEDMGSGCGEWRYWLQRGDHVIAKCASEEEAKAAAQSNYDTTILSAIHPNQESGE